MELFFLIQSPPPLLYRERCPLRGAFNNDQPTIVMLVRIAAAQLKVTHNRKIAQSSKTILTLPARNVTTFSKPMLSLMNLKKKECWKEFQLKSCGSQWFFPLPLHFWFIRRDGLELLLSCWKTKCRHKGSIRGHVSTHMGLVGRAPLLCSKFEPCLVSK